MQKILTNSTPKAQLCSPVLVSVNEVEKAELTPVGEKTQSLSIAPSQSIKVQPIMSIIVYQRNDLMPLHVNTMAQNVSIPTITIIEQKGTLVQIVLESSPTPTQQAQGEE